MTYEKVYFGDLHGNTLKMLLELKAEGLVSNLDEHYQDLTNAYWKNDVGAFTDAVNKLEFVSDPNKQLCYLGDTLADRGMNDYFTLFLMQKMTENNINYEVILSNHDIEFIKNIEMMKNKEFDSCTTQIEEPQAQSFNNFINYISGLSQEEHENINLNSMIANYVDHLKFCSLDVDTETGVNYLGTHAPWSSEIMTALVEKVKGYDHKTKRTLADFVEVLNDNFMQILTDEFKAHDNDLYENENAVIVNCTWNRETDIEDFNNFQVPGITKSAGTPWGHIHGHHGNGSKCYGNSINLDNKNGKGGTPIIKNNLINETLRIECCEHQPMPGKPKETPMAQQDDGLDVGW